MPRWWWLLVLCLAACDDGPADGTGGAAGNGAAGAATPVAGAEAPSAGAGGRAPDDAGSPPEPAGTTTDAGADAGRELAGGNDAGQDAGTESMDAAIDAGQDAGVDAGTDAGTDAAVDAGADAGTDAGIDAGRDAGPDDQCPLDPDKLEPGVCGCGTPDDDADMDGALDCEDVCPLDPALQEEGTITFDVSLATAAAAYAAYFPDMERCLEWAGDRWASSLVVPHDVVIQLEARVEDVPTANAGSESTAFVRSDGGLNIYEQSVAAEIRTGVDPNGTTIDGHVIFGITPLTGAGAWYYWFDPDPAARSATIPADGRDALSTCMHELGHVLMFNGWRDWASWELPGSYASVFDFLSSDDGVNPYFDGALAVEEYGTSVPETFDLPVHMGNLDPRPGMDLDLSIMHGTPTYFATRYDIGDLERAILADGGLPVRGTQAAAELCADPSFSIQSFTGPVLGPPPLSVE